ncbi:putative RNA-directed DNA polymerase [Senna tora]|uniref:Putative RNA-directed DNA polymerase n=1 Tax=Senna tora TaxID=362788 RepID=A0A835CIM6_9FABA|nr:putative RNA-directed DNA polymerase [Senna tora]
MASSDAINSSSSNVPAIVPLHIPLPDTSKIEAFDGKNFTQCYICTELLMLLKSLNLLMMLHKPRKIFGNMPTSVYKEANKIWESLILKYTTEDAGKQKFVVGNFYKWEMVDDKDIKQQINEYHRLLEELHTEKITLPDEFVAGILIEKLPESWSAYKQQLKHKQKQLSLSDLITHIIIENTNRKAIQIAKGKGMTAKANLVESHKR